MYQVEKVVGKRINPKTKKPEYQVKWSGFHTSDNTWEPEENLVFVRHLIEKFNNTQKPETKKGLSFTKQLGGMPNLHKSSANIYNASRNLDNYGDFSDVQDDNLSCSNDDLLKSARSLISERLKEQIQSTRIGKKLPPLPPDFKKNRNKYIDLHSPKKVEKEQKNCIINVEEEVNVNQFADSFAQSFVKKSNSISYEKDVQKKKKKPTGIEKFLENFENSASQKKGTKKSQKGSFKQHIKPPSRTQIRVLRILGMQKTSNGFFYQAETPNGILWLQRSEIVPAFATELCQYYESNLIFN